MDSNSLRKIIESSIAVLEGNSFQDFCDRMRLVLYPNDYTSVRAGGPEGDQKNDGYCPKARIFFQDHATRGESESKIKAKIKADLEGCIEKHPDIKSWIFLTNTTLTGNVETFIDNLRSENPSIQIETWDHKKISLKISALGKKEIEYILDILGISDKPTLPDESDLDNIPKSNNLERFVFLLDNGIWEKEFIDNQEIWVCQEDPMYQIEECNDNSEFTESWTQVYPDKFGSGRNSVNLNIFGVPIKQLYFIHCDGGRISVPMPRLRPEKEEVKYYWLRNSIEYKVAKIIGSFYIYDNIEGVAAMSKIEVE